MYSTIQHSVDGHIGTITLNRPERKNALSPEMVNELLYALEAAANDQNVRVIVLSGNGKAFCTGGDLGQMAAGGAPQGTLPLKGDYADLLLALVRVPKPVVAKVQGSALGGGLGLVAACTLAVASTHAQLGTPEVSLGLFPMIIMAVLARNMPRKAMLEMVLLGHKLSSEEGLRLGLLNRVVPPERLDSEVRALAEQLAQRSPVATARGLAAYTELGDMTLAEALPRLRDEFYALLTTEDAREGLMAFMEKRAPRWIGR